MLFRLSNDFSTSAMDEGLFELLCIRTKINLWMPRSSVMTQQTPLDQKFLCLKLLNHLPKKIKNGRQSGVGKSDGLQSTPVGSFGASWKNASAISDSQGWIDNRAYSWWKIHFPELFCQGPSRRDNEQLVTHWFVSCIDSVNHSITMRYRWGD